MEALYEHQRYHRIQGAQRPLRMDRGYAHSVSGGAGGRDIKISTVANGTRAGSFGARQDHRSSFDFGSLAISNEKIAMQNLNDRLASYLETVRNLEKANSRLEIKIRECIEKRGPREGKDFTKYNTIIGELRAKIFETITDNKRLAISLENARLSSDEFRNKMEYEMYLRQMVEADVAVLRKELDNTTLKRLGLETHVEDLKKELITLKKDHETDVAEMHAQITQAGVKVDVDAPKGQDLAKILEEMRANYERIALKNQEELKKWHESQIKEVQVQVTMSTAALEENTSVLTLKKKECQKLDIKLQSEHNLRASREAYQQDIEMRQNMEMKKYNADILMLKNEVTQIRNDIQQKAREYDHLLNVKVKLEAEIMEYRRLLDGGEELRLEDAVDSKMIQTRVVTVTQTMVDGKLVSESTDVKSSEKAAV